MLDMLIVIAANVFRIYAIFRFMRVFFDKEALSKMEFSTYIFYKGLLKFIEVNIKFK